MHYRKEIIELLTTFVETGIVPDMGGGLCMSLYSLDWSVSHYTQRDLKPIFRSWEEFSGSVKYPIPAPWWYLGLGTPEHYYRSNLGGRFYKGRQLRLRLSLAKHIITCLQEEK